MNVSTALKHSQGRREGQPNVQKDQIKDITTTTSINETRKEIGEVNLTASPSLTAS